jgi:hypothetical protein
MSASREHDSSSSKQHRSNSQDSDRLQNLVSSSSEPEPELPVVTFPLSSPSAHCTCLFLEMTPYLFEKDRDVRRLGTLT